MWPRGKLYTLVCGGMPSYLPEVFQRIELKCQLALTSTCPFSCTLRPDCDLRFSYCAEVKPAETWCRNDVIWQVMSRAWAEPPSRCTVANGGCGMWQL